MLQVGTGNHREAFGSSEHFLPNFTHSHIERMLFRGFVPRVPCLACDLIPRYVPACSPSTGACLSTPPVCPAGTRLTSLVGGPLLPACSSEGLEPQQLHTWPRSEDPSPALANSLFRSNPQTLAPGWANHLCVAHSENSHQWEWGRVGACLSA